MTPIDAVNSVQMRCDIVRRAASLANIPDSQIPIMGRCQKMSRHTIEAHLGGTSWGYTKAIRWTYKEMIVFITHADGIQRQSGFPGLPKIPDVGEGINGAADQQVGILAVPVDVGHSACVPAKGVFIEGFCCTPSYDVNVLARLKRKGF